MDTLPGNPADRRAPRTKCKVCWCSIFADDDTRWVTQPNPGIAHRICAEEQKRNQ